MTDCSTNHKEQLGHGIQVALIFWVTISKRSGVFVCNMRNQLATNAGIKIQAVQISSKYLQLYYINFAIA